MKKIFSILVGLVFLFSLTTQTQAADDIVVNNHHVEIVVDENGEYRFTHTLDVTFDTPYYGIFVNLPQEYDMEWTLEDGTTANRNYLFPLSDFDIEGPYEFERSREGVQLRLGEEGVYVSGEKQYKYSYTMNTKDLRLNGRQRFYINILGDQWEMITEKLTFEIYFPKDINEENIYFYSGRHGTNTEADVEYSYSNNILSGETQTILNDYEALTVDIELAPGYFEFPDQLDYSVIGLAYGSGLFGLLLFLFMKYGRDEKPVPTVQFEAPKELSSAQVGYVYDGFTDTTDILSLIIYWASLGYLTIEEIDKKTIQLTKVQELPQDTISAEKVIFQGLFEKGDQVTNDSLKHSFYHTLTSGQRNITRFFTGNKKRNIFSKRSDALQVLFGFLMPSILAVYLCLSYYQVTYYWIESFMFMGFVWGIGLVLSIVSILVQRKYHTFKSFVKLFSILGVGILLFVYLMIVAGASFIAEAQTFVVFVLSLLYIIGLFVNSKMHQRTAQGLAYLNDILGLKNFIELAEKDRLEALVDEDPEYFYHILPYAYVLNVTDKWSKKFESIAIEPPSWYVGPTPMNSVIFMSHFNRSMGTLASSMSAPPPSKGGSGGGGFGGGGGLSGGGFGGGGGGGWR